MRNVWHILSYKAFNLLYYLRKSDFELKMRFFVGLFVIAIFFSAGLYFFHFIFSYLSTLNEIGMMLMNKVLAIGFLAILIMLVISNIVTSISTLYRSPETMTLLAKPVSHLEVFAVRFIDNIVYSTWGVALLGIPIIVAYGLVRGFAWWVYPVEVIFILLPFTIIPACIGVGSSMMIYTISKYVKPKIVLISMLVAAVGGIFLYLKLGQQSSLTRNIFADWRVLNHFLGSLGATSFPFLPTYWVTETLRYFAGEASASLTIHLTALLSTTALLLRGLFVFAKATFYSSWQAAVELGATQTETIKAPRKLPKIFRLPDWLAPDFRSVLAKDMKLFIREPSQWAQFTVLLVLLVIYLINLRHLTPNLQDKFWTTIITFANFAFTGFILATLAVRFVFPNISLEGKSFWVIASSPMSIKRLFWEKFWLVFFIFLLLAEIIALISNLLLGISGYMMMFSFLSILLMSITLTSLSVGMGATFPRFDEPNPGRIASSIGGMITTVISLLYVGLMVVILAFATYYYSRHVIDGTIGFPAEEFFYAGVMIFVLNLAATSIPIMIGLRSLSNREF